MKIVQLRYATYLEKRISKKKKIMCITISVWLSVQKQLTSKDVQVITCW